MIFVVYVSLLLLKTDVSRYYSTTSMRFYFKELKYKYHNYRHLLEFLGTSLAFILLYKSWHATSVHISTFLNCFFLLLPVSALWHLVRLTISLFLVLVFCIRLVLYYSCNNPLQCCRSFANRPCRFLFY